MTHSSEDSYTDDGSSQSIDQHEVLRNEIDHCRYAQIDLVKFVQTVWGLDRSTCERILNLPLSLDASKIGDYKTNHKERLRRGIFAAFTESLLQDVQEHLQVPPKERVHGLWYAKRRPSRTRDSQTEPVLMGLWDPFPSKGRVPDWSVARHIIEMAPQVQPAVPLDEDQAKSSLSHQQTAPATTLLPLVSRASHDQGSDNSRSTQKRSRDASDDGSERDRKRRRLDEEYTDSHLQLASYAQDCLASTCRLWVTGLVIDGCKVSLTYFDRQLVATTSPFLFDKEPSKLALVLYAMGQCDRTKAGFDPHLRAWPSHTIEPITESMKRQLERPVESVIGSFIEFPAGTNDIPALPSSQPTLPSCFRVSGWILKPGALISRTTMIYKIQMLLEDKSLSRDDYALKLSWPPKSRTSEIDVLKELKKKLPTRLHAHLPDLQFATTFTAEDLCLPSLKLGLATLAPGPENHEPRVLRVLAMKYYHKLWTAGSIEGFKQTWLDCVECHHEAWKAGGILHQDLSENNLMVSRLGGKVSGLLNDWDLAVFVNTPEGKSTIHYRTGTPPFMAIELLDPLKFITYKPGHWYRHDLESFFYILVWAALHYNLKEGTRDKAVHPTLLPWISRDARRNALAKLTFGVPGDTVANWAFDSVKAEFEPLLKEWILPLRKLLRVARCSFEKAVGEYVPTDVYDYPTCGGILTFETFMATIGCPVRNWADGDLP